MRKQPTAPQVEGGAESHTLSIADLREIRARAWRRLAAAVPVAIATMTKRKAKLEGQIDAGKKLSSGDQKELDEIRALLNRVELNKVCALLSRMDLEKIQAALRQVATRGTR
jgi:mRNA-degrading endonuclease toxin of MazEF toxin-antitoxin module